MTRSDRAARLTPSQAVLVLSGCGFTGQNLLFAVVPVLAARTGGRIGAGLATAVFMGATVLVQATMPQVMARVRPHVLLGLSLLLLGAPALLYEVASSLTLVLAVTAVRGAGFGILTVVGSALVSRYAPPARHGSAIGAYGLAVSLTGMVAPPLGLFLLNHGWETQTALLGTLVPLASLLLLAVVRQASPEPLAKKGPAARRLRSVWRDPALVAPVLLFFPCALSYGGVYTFLPLLSQDAPTALLFYGCGFAAARFACGRLSDTITPRVLAAPLLGAVVAGTGAMTVFPAGAGLAATALLAGVGVGGMATVSLVAVMAEATDTEIALASALWNLVFDGGIGFGGVALGLVAESAGYRAVFVVSVAATAVALGAAVLRLMRRRTRRNSRSAPGA
ncbi:MFS transporter [Planosporangium thailandense]|uniref:MFS transporter n=1 Tax=Planosporangium thailandense TaxID=765197 RepID=A0ABX0XZA8_9ACTN|nr:MFS transporter [Planosporangium thailandense]